MASAQEELYQGYTGSTYYMDNNPMSFDDWWRVGTMGSNPKYSSFGWHSDNPYSLGNKIQNWFTGSLTSAEKEYDRYINDWYDQRNQERAAYANWQTQQREDSAVQRAKEDYLKAGFSPYSLIMSNYSSPSSAMNYATRKGQDFNEKNKESDKMVSTALKIMALLILKKAL